MRTKEAARMVMGSITIYVVMAACSASSGTQSTGSNDGGAHHGASGSGSGGGVVEDGSGGEPIEDGSGKSIIDAITDPVSEASADSTQSGSRLKAQYYAGADGSKLSLGLYDSQLNVSCYYETASDGTLRCVPSTAANVGLYGYYADSGCSQPLAVASAGSGCAAPAYAYSYVASSGCATVWHVFPISAPYTATSYFMLTDTFLPDGGIGKTCTASPVSGLGASTSLYTVGAELPPSTFVEATLQTEP